MRKLATAALAFSVAVFAANYILPLTWLPICAVCLAVVGAGLSAFRRKWLRGLVIALIAAAVGFGLFYYHAQRTTVRALSDNTSAGEFRLAYAEADFRSIENLEAADIDLPGGGKMYLTGRIDRARRVAHVEKSVAAGYSIACWMSCRMN